MDRLTVLQEVIDRTSRAADQYGADGTAMEIHGPDILTGNSLDRYSWNAGALQRILLDIAEDHAGCPVPDCRTCASIRQGLAMSLAGLRSLRQEELDAQLSADAPQRAWWRILHGHG